MKNLILASFLTLIFTQDLITTRVFEVPIEVFYYAADDTYQDSNGGYFYGNINLADIFDVSAGNITNMIPQCEFSGGSDWYNIEIALGEMGYVGSHISYAPNDGGIRFLNYGNLGFIAEDFFSNSLEVRYTEFGFDFENINPGNCSGIEFWVEADFGDSGSSGLQGDMNLDGNLDILDVVEIISVILNDV